MRPSPELDQLRERLQVTAGELGRQLEQLRRPPSPFEAGDGGDRLEDVAEDYIALSNHTADAIADAAGEQDAQAVDLLTRLIGLDLEVAQRLIGHATFEGDDGAPAPFESTVIAEPDPALREELDALEDLGAVARAAVRDRPLAPAEVFEAAVGRADPGDIDGPIGAIVEEAAKTITATFKAVGWASVVNDFTALAGRIGGDDARRAIEGVVTAARGFLKRASRLAAEVLGAVVEKIARFLGPAGFRSVIDAIKDKIAGWWNDVPGEGVAAQALGAVLQRAAVRQASEARLRDQAPDRVAAAVEAAERLAASNHDGLVWVRRGNKALEWAGAVKPFVKATGAMTLVALVGVALAAYTAWLAHDHLDSPTLADQIPDRVKGVRQTVHAMSS